MKSIKYTLIFIFLLLIGYLWMFVPAALERGLPTNPVYYISAGIGIILGFMFFRVTRANVTRRWLGLVVILFIVMTIAFNVSGVEILRQIGSGLLFWSLFASLGFYGYFLIRKRSSNKELTEAEENFEYTSKGISLAMIFLIIALLPALLIIALLVFLFNR